MNPIRLLATSALTLIAGTAVAAPDDKWQPTFELEGRASSDRSIAYPKFLIPLRQDENSMLFTDLRMRADDNKSQEYNAGLGYRQMSGDWIYGGYLFLDYLSSANDNEYWQGTAGFEMLSQDWDFRINGYLPESTVNTFGGGGPGGLTIDGGGNFGITTAGGLRERAMPGFDTEVGYRLPVDFIDTRIFGGYYHFDASGFDDVSGPKARLELTAKHEHLDAIPEGVEFTLGAQFQNDGPREDTTTALAQLRIPLGSDSSARPRLNRLEQRMTNFIERDVDIVAAAGSSASTTEAATVTINGQTYSNITATVDANTTDVNAALTAAGANTFILVDGSAGPINTSLGIFATRAGQTLVGGGASITATGVTSNTTATGTLSGSRPTISNTGGTVISLNNVSNVTLMNMDVEVGGFINTAINTSNSGNLIIDNVTVTGTPGDRNQAIRVGNSANSVVRNVTVDQVENGIYLSASSGTSISDVTATNIGGTFGAGIFLNSSDDVTITNAAIDTANYRGLGILNSNNTAMSNVSISNTGNYGITLDSANNLNGNVTVSGSTGVDCDVTGAPSSGTFTMNGVSNTVAAHCP